MLCETVSVNLVPVLDPPLAACQSGQFNSGKSGRAATAFGLVGWGTRQDRLVSGCLSLGLSWTCKKERWTINCDGWQGGRQCYLCLHTVKF